MNLSTTTHENGNLNDDHRLNMDQVRVDPKWALRVPANLAIRRKLLPFTVENEHVLVACQDDSDIAGIQAVQRYLSLPVVASVAEPQSLTRAINRIFVDPAQTIGTSGNPARVNLQPNAPNSFDIEGDDVVNLGDEIFHAALIQQATDIHIEPEQNTVRIRVRVDGKLEDYRSIPKSIHSALISRLKVLGGMDIAERRAPQDGRFTLGKDKQKMVDVRAATIPTKHGERMTMRLLAPHSQDLTLEKLGMLDQDLELLNSKIEKPNGLILLTGPTGCGKSTTLYAAIRKLVACRAPNVITIEDPVEYVIDGTSQVEVDSADKVSFHKALRSVLRHDPDVLMIGEIRDEETAEIAIKAALTGHLVFTTLHTSSAADSVTRLIDMGVRPFLLSTVARLFMAQRLVRRLCPYCRVPVAMTDEQAKYLHQPQMAGTRIFAAAGCKYCANNGYHGRTGLFELLPVERESREITNTSADSLINSICQTSSQHGTLITDAAEKLRLGITSFDEIAMVVG